MNFTLNDLDKWILFNIFSYLDIDTFIKLYDHGPLETVQEYHQYHNRCKEINRISNFSSEYLCSQFTVVNKKKIREDIVEILYDRAKMSINCGNRYSVRYYKKVVLQNTSRGIDYKAFYLLKYDFDFLWIYAEKLQYSGTRMKHLFGIAPFWSMINYEGSDPEDEYIDYNKHRLSSIYKDYVIAGLKYYPQLLARYDYIELIHDEFTDEEIEELKKIKEETKVLWPLTSKHKII